MTEDHVDLAAIDALIAAVGRQSRHVIPILQSVQEKYNYLPEPILRHLCLKTEIMPADITGIMSFYSQFRDRPAGKHFVRVCIGTACHVKGASNITDAFRRYLEIEGEEDTDREGLFTVEEVACLGCCMLAPAVQIDDLIYGFVEPQKVGQVLSDFLASREKAPGVEAGAAGAGAAEVRLCQCSSCRASGADVVYQEIGQAAADLDLPIKLKTVGCTGISYQTPLVEIVEPDGEIFRYGRVAPAMVRRMLQRHVRPVGVGGRLRSGMRSMVERILTDRGREPVTRFSVDIRQGPDADYVSCQQRIATSGAGVLDPLDLDAYIDQGGMQALETSLSGKTPEAVISRIIDSGLRGRGGGGFPTGRKWFMVRAEKGRPTYLICNGDEGDPGAFMDRMLLESFPFRVIEGILIAAYAVGAAEGFVYVRAEYPLAVARLREALDILEARGWLGDRILDSNLSFRLHIVQGAGAFVCGEETALIAAVEGKRGMPRYRPPFPAASGVFGKPTLVNNVETFALVPGIISGEEDAFRSLGTDDSSGTKAFALAGKVVRGGLVEVPMGITIREIVEQIGGGIQDGKALKAVQIGGPSGGCVPASLADTPIDYDALISAGAIMGSGGLVVLDETDCMVDIAKYFLTFTQLESCGKCTFCRIGTKRMLEILERITEGDGREDDIDALEELAATIKQGSLCNLGKTAPNPVLSTINHFRDEYEAHIKGACPAAKCKALIAYTINDDCIGCTRCSQRCPVTAIPMTPYEKHIIDAEKCIRCDTCRQVCPVDAVEVK